MDDDSAEIEDIVCAEMCLVPKAVVSQLEEPIWRTHVRGDERESLGTFVDRPGDHDTKEDSCVEQQLFREAGTTTEETGYDMGGDDP